MTRSQMAFIRAVLGSVVMILSPSDLNTSPNAVQTQQAQRHHALRRQQPQHLAEQPAQRLFVPGPEPGRNASVAGRQCLEAVLRLHADPRSAARLRAYLVVQVDRVIEVVPGKAGEAGLPAYLLG
jgi:hypothetical protein